MIRKAICLLYVVLISLAIDAVPVKKGMWRSIRLADGTTVRVMPKGDEFVHYLESEKGERFVFDSLTQTYRKIDAQELVKRGARKRAAVNARRQARNRITLGEKQPTLSGTRKSLVILVQFSDKKFQPNHDLTLYQRYANEENFTDPLGFKGSVKDYFKDQSRGLFTIDFDVVGPVDLPEKYSYYGANTTNDEDIRPEEMVRQACQAVDDQVDFKDYVWGKDKTVNMVYILYAGQGENTTYGEDDDTIWPHQFELSANGAPLNLDGVKIDTYACGPEMQSATKIEGIGTFCHEYSHTLGLADMYDTADNGCYGLATWGIMDQGSYNGNSFVPAGYTSYERSYLGWLNPIELTEDQTITGLKPLTDGGDAYILYNNNNRNEYYLLENRQKTGWDAELDGKGLLVLHVDFNAKAWANNEVNTNPSHQRCTVIPADNSLKAYDRFDNFLPSDIAGDAYPYRENDSLTQTSKPQAALFNTNKSGTKLMNGAITGITQQSDGTINFNFRVDNKAPVIPSADEEKGILLHESFDQCDGTGGNSGGFSGRVASSATAFKPDVEGWTVPSGAVYGGDRCAKFGASSKSGMVISPTFNATGKDTLTFVAAPWGNDGNTLDVYVNDKLLGVYTLAANQWTTISVPFCTQGPATIQFTPAKRFFLDDVLVTTQRKTTSGIVAVEERKARWHDRRIYNLSGQYMGSDLRLLPKGVYIQNGKKILKVGSKK